MSRTTVVRACDELVAEGWLSCSPGRGLFVLAPSNEVAHRRPVGDLGFALPEVERARPRRLHAPEGVPYRLVGGLPDLRLLPLQELAAAYRRALRGRGRRLVSYTDPQGSPRFRRSLGRWLAQTRGLVADPSRLLITRGSQMALYLLARTLLGAGDKVAVEGWGYPPAWQAFRQAGASLVGVPVDEQGLVVEAIPDDVRAVYVTPHHQYPTGVVMSASRRLALLEFARRRRIPVFEDDYDHEYHYVGSPVLPLAALDRHGVVVYIGTLSKAFAPGLRLGWVDGAPELIERLTAYRRLVDRQGDQVVEHAMAELLDEGLVQRHIRRTRRVYAERREVLLERLSRLPVTPHVAPGGLAIWSAAPGVDVDVWSERAEAAGVFFNTGAAYSLAADCGPFVRMGFAGHSAEELNEAMDRVAAAL